MLYLLTQMLICLLIAFLLGFLLGLLLSRLFAGNKNKVEKNSSASYVADDRHNDLDDDLDDLDDLDDDFGNDPNYNNALMADITDLDTPVDLDADSYKIETMEGIGPQTGELFRKYGVQTVGDYLRKLHSLPLREQAAKHMNILIKPLNEWASMADLLRVNGIDHQYAELAYKSGINTVGELAEQNADTLAAEMERVNNSGKQLISPTSPSNADVRNWIAQAKTMKTVITV